MTAQTVGHVPCQFVLQKRTEPNSDSEMRVHAQKLTVPETSKLLAKFGPNKLRPPSRKMLYLVLKQVLFNMKEQLIRAKDVNSSCFNHFYVLLCIDLHCLVCICWRSL